jgi:hypothetical protein
MTIERKVIVGVEDVKAVIFECKGCKARVTISPDGARIPQRCPNCQEQWLSSSVSTTSTSLSAYVAFLESLGKMREKALETNGEWPKFRILFEFDEPGLTGSH